MKFCEKLQFADNLSLTDLLIFQNSQKLLKYLCGIFLYILFLANCKIEKISYVDPPKHRKKVLY